MNWAVICHSNQDQLEAIRFTKFTFNHSLTFKCLSADDLFDSNGGCSSKCSFLFSGKRLLRNSKWDLLIPRLQRVLPARDIFFDETGNGLVPLCRVDYSKCLERVISLGCNKGK